MAAGAAVARGILSHVRQVTAATDPVYLSRPPAKVVRVCGRRPDVGPSGSGADFEASCAELSPLLGSLERGLTSTLPRQSLSCCSIVESAV